MAEEQLRSDARKADAFDRKRAEAFAAMVRTEGWRYFEELLTHHINERTSRLFEPLKHGERDASEHNKGAVYGLIYARDLPRVTVVAMNELVSSDEQPAGE